MRPGLEDAQGVGRVALAMVLGGALGLNRSLRGKAVGPRTMALVAMGAALLAWLGSVYAAHEPDGGNDASAATRVLQGIITGIGFLGAGVILRDRAQHVRGLTTASAIWFAAAMGGAAGAGQGWVALGTTALALAVLASAPLERRLRQRLTRGGDADDPPR